MNLTNSHLVGIIIIPSWGQEWGSMRWTAVVGEHFSKEELVVKLDMPKKTVGKRKQSYVLQTFQFHTESFSKKLNCVSMHSCMRIPNRLFSQQLFWEMHQPSSSGYTHLLLGLHVTIPAPTVFTVTGTCLKASVPATSSACKHFCFNFPKLSTFKYLWRKANTT